MAQRGGRTGEQRAKSFVEATHAVEARGQRHLRHRQRRLVDQLLGEQDASRLSDRDRRCPDVLVKQPPQLPGADAEPVRQAFDIVFIEAA
jgi:hypothetical protein